MSHASLLPEIYFKRIYIGIPKTLQNFLITSFYYRDF